MGLITTAEAGRILGRDPRVVRRMITRGVLTGHRDERYRWLVEEAEVRALVAMSRPSGRPPRPPGSTTVLSVLTHLVMALVVLKTIDLTVVDLPFI